MTIPDNDAPTPEQTSAPSPRRYALWLRAVLPHIITACVAIAVTLALVSFLPRSQPVTSFPPTSAPTAASPAPTDAPVTPTPTPLPLAPGVARQEIADLQAEDDHIWATVYLLKAINQVAEAETMLRANDTPAIDQALIAADYSLSLAYERSDESQKSPIDQFRRNIDRIRGDLYLYPERMDSRLAQLRQLLLTLIDEPQ